MCACWRMVPVFAVLQICLTRHALRLLWSVHVSCTRRTGSAGLHHFRVMRQSPCTIWRVPPSALGPHNWQPQQQSPSFLTACPCKGSHAALCCPPRARACHQAPEWLAQAACRYTHTQRAVYMPQQVAAAARHRRRALPSPVPCPHAPYGSLQETCAATSQHMGAHPMAKPRWANPEKHSTTEARRPVGLDGPRGATCGEGPDVHRANQETTHS